MARAGDDVAYSLIRSNQWNVVLSDTLAFDAGYGPETLFTLLSDAPPPSTTGTLPGAPGPHTPAHHSQGQHGPVVAPFQIVNHLPNAPALTNKAAMIRCVLCVGVGRGSPRPAVPSAP